MAVDTKNTRDLFFDSYLSAMSSFCWAQDQAEKIVKAWMDHGKTTREEGKKLLEELVSQTRRNQEEFTKMIQDGVKTVMSGFRLPTSAEVDALQKKLDELTGKVEALEKTRKAA
ncbi:MAG: phasin family protein [Armatimonadetes bacterium]|nr:phasin family protein [Armatimonadota bacterium]